MNRNHFRQVAVHTATEHDIYTRAILKLAVGPACAYNYISAPRAANNSFTKSSYCNCGCCAEALERKIIDSVANGFDVFEFRVRGSKSTHI
jgi:hypothetical protein